MRLIDKDLVLKTAKDKEWGLWCEIANIKFAPEVKAIPVEWVEKYIDNRLVKHGDTWTFINYMINDWEKENANNKT